ncbi:hypothetical protein [Iodidimonas sp. SYSU 1G8]|uniref:hypothetical protein n=1 Tax=Iodidimonas sp. SYSU 1G8 TaxID=3133967 RepID=UPI0031FEF98E
MHLDTRKPVCTREAKLPVRIICTDARLPGGISIVALIEVRPGVETVATYTAEGRFGGPENGHALDLINILVN